MTFYIGNYLVQQDFLELDFEGEAWSLPEDADLQHVKETSNVEDLWIAPEDLDIVPEEMQFGLIQWSDDDEPTSTWGLFYNPSLSTEFYLRDFSPVDFFAEFYIPVEFFYVQNFTPTDLFTEFYFGTGGFYVRDFAPTDLFTEFYFGTGGFYVRDFAPFDFFYAIGGGN